MLTAYREGQGYKVVEDFRAAKPQQVLLHWHPLSWQMLLESALELGDFPAGRAAKVQEQKDHLPSQVTWPAASGQRVLFMEGTAVFPSTQELLQAHSLQELLEVKRRFYPAQDPFTPGR